LPTFADAGLRNGETVSIEMANRIKELERRVAELESIVRALTERRKTLTLPNKQQANG